MCDFGPAAAVMGACCERQRREDIRIEPPDVNVPCEELEEE
jgi:hypothetical protein